jgi:hypothetical protein
MEEFPASLTTSIAGSLEEEEALLSAELAEMKLKIDQQMSVIQRQLNAVEEAERVAVVTASVQASVSRSRESELKRFEERIALLEANLRTAQKEHALAMEESREQREKARCLRQEVAGKMVSLSASFAHLEASPSKLDADGWAQVLAVDTPRPAAQLLPTTCTDPPAQLLGCAPASEETPSTAAVKEDLIAAPHRAAQKQRIFERYAASANRAIRRLPAKPTGSAKPM